MDRDALLKQVKQAVHEVEPAAEVILYGSRARGDSRDESDWDFLILVDGPVDDNRIDSIRHRVYEVEWDSGEVLTSIIRRRSEWSGHPLGSTPFHRSVEREGIVL